MLILETFRWARQRISKNRVFRSLKDTGCVGKISKAYNSSVDISDDVVLQVRNGLFLASSRATGETYLEPLIRKKYGLLKAPGENYDAKDLNNKRYEIKGSKVLLSIREKKKNKSLLEKVIFENENLAISRLIFFKDAHKSDYDANIQNIKRAECDVFIYVLMFADCMKIFSVSGDEIASKIPNWSDKHGLKDAPGENGQFPINRKNLAQHLKDFLIDTMTYREAAEIYAELSDKEGLQEYDDTESEEK